MNTRNHGCIPHGYKEASIDKVPATFNEIIEEMRARNLWQRQDSNQGPVHAGMPNIQEKREEEEKDSANTETIAKSV